MQRSFATISHHAIIIPWPIFCNIKGPGLTALVSSIALALDLFRLVAHIKVHRLRQIVDQGP
jgi:hypothetical protein